MKLEFRPLEITDKKIIEDFLGTQHKHIGWEYNFAMTWMWNIFEKTVICVLDDMILLKTTFYGKCVFYTPYLKKQDDLPKALSIIENAIQSVDCTLDVRGLVKEQLSYIDETKYDITTNRDNSDYIYKAEDLINLTGKKFHAKRNFVSRFKRNYEYIFREYVDSDFDKIMELYEVWDDATAHETLDAEKKVIKNALRYKNYIDIKVSVIEIDSKIVAFSISDNSNKFMAHTFIEKADIKYEGIYQAINQFNAELFFKDNLYVNRQEDMGIEGLRKAKLSYNPEMIVDKYYIKAK